MSRIPCTACRAPVATGHTLCPAHVEDLGAILGRLSTILDDLDVTISRQNRMAVTHTRVKSDERPLPFAVEASNRHHDLTISIGRWAEAFGVVQYGAGLARSGAPRAQARYLVVMLPAIVRHPDAGAMLRDFERLVERAQREIDRPPDLLYVGICSANGCTHDIYTDPAQATATCAVCGARHDVAERRAIMLSHVEDVLATAAEIARAVATYGADGDFLTVTRIRQWKRRGRIVPRGVDKRGDPKYRVGDVLDLVRHAGRRRPLQKAAKTPDQP